METSEIEKSQEVLKKLQEMKQKLIQETHGNVETPEIIKNEKIIENEKELNVTYHGIKKLLNSSKKKIDEELKHILFELECEGKIYEDDDFMYHKFPKNYRVATIVQDNNGKCFVRIGNNFHEIKDNKLNSALNGDKVIVKKVKKSKTYEVIKILKRAKGKILCELKMDEKSIMLGKRIVLVKLWSLQF